MEKPGFTERVMTVMVSNLFIRGSVGVDLPVVTLEDRCMRTFVFRVLLSFSFSRNLHTTLLRQKWMDGSLFSRAVLFSRHAEIGRRNLGERGGFFDIFIVCCLRGMERADGIRKCS